MLAGCWRGLGWNAMGSGTRSEESDGEAFVLGVLSTLSTMLQRQRQRQMRPLRFVWAARTTSRIALSTASEPSFDQLQDDGRWIGVGSRIRAMLLKVLCDHARGGHRETRPASGGNILVRVLNGRTIDSDCLFRPRTDADPVLEDEGPPRACQRRPRSCRQAPQTSGWSRSRRWSTPPQDQYVPAKTSSALDQMTDLPFPQTSTSTITVTSERSVCASTTRPRTSSTGPSSTSTSSWCVASSLNLSPSQVTD